MFLDRWRPGVITHAGLNQQVLTFDKRCLFQDAKTYGKERVPSNTEHTHTKKHNVNI